MAFTTGTSSRSASWRGAATILLLGFISLLLVPRNVFVAHQTISAGQNLLDISWSTDIANRTSVGEWPGRDYIFTAGPLYQLSHGLGLLIPPGDIASQLRFQDTPERILVVVILWAILGLVTAPWKLRVGVFIFWGLFLAAGAQCWVGVKPFAGMYLTALAGRALQSSRPMAPAKLLLYAGAAPLVLWYSFDSGLYTLLALGLMLAGVTLTVLGRDKKQVWNGLNALVTVLFGFAFLSIVFPMLLGAGHYWPDSLDMALNYAIMMAFPLSTQNLGVLLLTGLGAFAIFAWALLRLRGANDPDAKMNFGALAAAAAFAVVATRAGYTRSDPGHVGQAVLPAFYLMAGPLVLHGLNSGKRCVLLFLLVPVPLYRAASMLRPSAALASSAQQLVAASRTEWSRATLTVEQPQVLAAQAALRQDHSPAVLVWPFATLICDLLGHHNPWYTVQPYAAHSDHLENRTIEQLEKWPTLPVLFYGAEPGLSNVANPTRTPLIFKYLLENFTLAQRRRDPFVLRRRTASEKLIYTPKTLPVDPAELRPGATLSLKSRTGAEWCGEADILELTIRPARTRLLAIGKPGRIVLTFHFSDHGSATQEVMLKPDGNAHPVLVTAQPASDPEFMHHFEIHPAAVSKRRVRSLDLEWLPMDRLSVRPAFVRVENVSELVPRAVAAKK